MIDIFYQTSTHPRQHTLRSVGETDGALVQSLRLRCGARRRWHGSLCRWRDGGRRRLMMVEWRGLSGEKGKVLLCWCGVRVRI